MHTCIFGFFSERGGRVKAGVGPVRLQQTEHKRPPVGSASVAVDGLQQKGCRLPGGKPEKCDNDRQNAGDVNGYAYIIQNRHKAHTEMVDRRLADNNRGKRQVKIPRRAGNTKKRKSKLRTAVVDAGDSGIFTWRLPRLLS